MLVSQYDPLLVGISLLVAMLASYTAMDMAGRINAIRGKSVFAWLAGGALAMGIGIWSMHFIGMLAFSLPIPVGYDPGITILSLLIAISASGFALWRVNQPQLTLIQLSASAVVMGIAIAAMHYTGMAAMHMHPAIEYDPLLFALSVAIAVGASGAALWITFVLRKNMPRVRLARAASAIVMGAAIVGMHYTGMAAANFPPGSICGASLHGIGTGALALVITVITLAILAIALLTSVYDARLESKTARLARSLAEVNAELKHQAMHDDLTGLPNRSLLEDRLEQILVKATRDRSHFALMFIDLDGFKSINDSLGHHVGDLLLIEVARRFRDTVRAQDTVARLGGDEFVVLIEVGAPEDAAPVADKLINIVNQPFVIAGLNLGVSASVGIAVYPEDGSSSHDLLTNADAAMYYTKAAGRNSYRFFEASMNANAHHHLAIMQDLRSAMERQEFRLHYQPKFDAATEKVIGAEALLRWQHPARGLIFPDEFIALAEKTGLIVSIGEWVLDQACKQMRAWCDQGKSEWKMAVNLSALQFVQDDLVASVQNSLRRHALPPSNLILEITESTAMHDVEASLAILNRLVEIGVQISIDDFGTGYSSLLCLKRMPATELKIDRGFIQQLAHGSDDTAIISAIVELGRSLNLRVVAEGVETEKQHSYLKALGCTVMQGFLMGRPVPAEQFMSALDKEFSST